MGRTHGGATTVTAGLLGRDLCLLRGDRCLFQNVEFTLETGELLLIEGQNGSGKTSLLRAIAGLLDFEEGEVQWQGCNIGANSQAFREQMVWLAHKVGFKADLTLVENLAFERGLRAASTNSFDEVLQRLDLAELTRLPFRALSAGQQRRVALARMLLADAALWMMDEPFTNLDSHGQSLVVELLAEHLRHGGLAVVASHQAVQLDAPIRRIRLQ